MQMTNSHPAQRQLVHRFIDWNIVEQWLKRFPAIGRAFPINLLRSHEETPPYYCHYMAWRLGTWDDETRFARLDELLAGAESLPNWSAEEPLLKSPEFGDFWSLVWQSQVAEYLCGIGSDVQWAPSGGPDLSAHVESEKWYVECYTYHKSFDLVLFIEEVVRQVDASICVRYDKCMPFSLPKDLKRSEFLDRTLSNFVDPAYVECARSMARKEYPVLLHPKGENSLVVYMEGLGTYVSGIVPTRTGDSQKYLENALNEVARAKQNANKLDIHHPNLVAANLSLSDGAFSAFNRADQLKLSIPDVLLSPNLDALAVAMIGIDKRLEWSRFRRIAPTITESLALNKMTCAV